MSRYFIKLAYNGATFHGWQSQPNAVSVQETIERALSTVFRREMKITGAGRTDTGVNARVMYAHFDLPQANGNAGIEAGMETKVESKTDVLDCGRLAVSLNRMCGRDITIEGVFGVPDGAHARFDAISRTYKYFVTFEESPFLKSFSWHSPGILDAEVMNSAAELLLGTHDFTSFAKLHSDAKTNLCTVTEAIWTPYENQYRVPGLVFTVTADRFLRNMVRALVGTLTDVGRGKRTIEDFKNVIDKRDRCAAGTSMPPQALFLWDIKYPQNIIP